MSLAEETTPEEQVSELTERTTDWMIRCVRIDAITKHPNADRLGIVNVLGGYQVLVGLGDFKPGDLAIFCTTDTLAPLARPEFKFLDSGHGRTHERIKAKRLRGVFSFGLLVPNTIGAHEGEDCANTLGCLKYLPPAEREHRDPNLNTLRKSRASETAGFDRITVAAGISASIMLATIFHGLPALLGILPLAAMYPLIKWNRWRNKRPNYPYYDVTSFRAYKDLIATGEDVVVTEKLHGSQASYCHTGRKFHMKSRTVFRGMGDNRKPWGFSFDEVWHKMADRYGLERKLKKHPGMVLFGEIVGPQIQKGFHYGRAPGEHGFYAFDVMRLEDRSFLDHGDFEKFCKDIEVPICPVVYRGAWSETLTNLANGKSYIAGANHIKEGIVFKPTKERRDPHAGRVQLKFVSEDYLLKKAGEEEDGS